MLIYHNVYKVELLFFGRGYHDYGALEGAQYDNVNRNQRRGDYVLQTFCLFIYNFLRELRDWN